MRDEGLVSKSDLPFKGNIDLEKLEACIQAETPANVPYMRLEAGTNPDRWTAHLLREHESGH